MRFTCAWACALVMSSMVTALAPAQSDSGNPRIENLEKRLESLEKSYQQELKQRDTEIARLRDELGQMSKRAGSSTRPDEDEIERTRQSVLKDIDSRSAAPISLRAPASMNPDIAVITDFQGSFSTRNSNSARNRMDIGSVELDFRSAVAPIADAVVAIPFFREVENPLFPEPDAEGEVEAGVELEEAYLFLHDLGIPNLTAKLGKFHLRFGRQNLLHTHDWPTADNAFVNQSFLGAEALGDSGLSLSYVLPPDWTNGHYLELIAEIITGEGNGEEGPVVNNSGSVDSPAINLHALWNHDIARDWNIELGGSMLFTKRNDDNQQHAALYGLDFTLIHTDPTGGFNNQFFQAEAIYGDIDTSREESQHAWGGYLLAQQQLNRDWYVGCRLDYTENALDDTQSVWGVSPYLTWYYFEFLRFRLEYQHKDGDVPAEDNLFFQATWIFGAHPPHPYWAMK